MSTHQPAEKIRAFRELHAAPGVFVIPNPWDATSARLLEARGFRALATSSAAGLCGVEEAGELDGGPAGSGFHAA